MHLLNKCETCDKNIKREQCGKTALLSLFLLLVIFFALAKSDMIAIAIVILKPCGFSDILFAKSSRSEYHSA